MKMTQLIAALTLTAMALPAQVQANENAAPNTAQTTVQFTYAANELANDSGRIALLDRLRTFARRQCGTVSHLPASMRQDCRSDIENQVVAAIANHQLAVLADARRYNV